MNPRQSLTNFVKAAVKHVLWAGLTVIHRSPLAPLRVRRGQAQGAILRLDLRSQGSYWLGSYDRYIFDRLDFKRFINQGEIAWDCGAFVGYYTAVFRRIVGESGRVITFEASGKNFRQLAGVPALNGWANVEIVNKAVGPDHSKIEFVGTMGGSSGPWLGKTFSQKITKDDLEVVQCCGVDELVYEMGFPAPDFIKFDLETAEVDALHNGPRVFREKRPILLLELHGDAALKAAGKFLEDYGYCAVPVDLLPRFTESSVDAWDKAFTELAAANSQELGEFGYLPHVLLCQPAERIDSGRRPDVGP